MATQRRRIEELRASTGSETPDESPWRGRLLLLEEGMSVEEGQVLARLDDSMAVGATFGALNTTYSAVAARSREIATLRALGFQGGPVVVSVMAESLLLALLGGLVGGGSPGPSRTAIRPPP